MRGIIVATHGDLGKGLMSSLKMFFGELPQFEAVCLVEGEDPDTYAARLLEAIQSVDTGEGVLVFCDIAFGTPCNSIMRNFRQFDEDKIEIISGVNLPMMLQVCTMRDAEEISVEEFKNAGTDGIIDIKAMILSRMAK